MLTISASTSAEQRSDHRVPLVLPARISVAGADPLDCSVIDLSLGGAGIHYHDAAPMADQVARIEIEGFGIFDGLTVRDAGNMRGLRFLHGEAERHNLIGKLTKFIENGLDEGSDDTISYPSTLAFRRTNGQEERCEIACITLQGVVLLTTQRPTLGELVRLGRLYGRVVRHFVGGVGVEFVSFVNPHDAPQQL
jgi:hypothetical protein